MSCPASLVAETAGRFAQQALALGEGEVCASYRRSFYLRFPGERYACVGERALGRGPLNALVPGFELPALGARVRVSVAHARPWTPPAFAASGAPALAALRDEARPRLPREGLACLIVGEHNALAIHAQPALEAIDRWLVGHALDQDAGRLIGLGPGLTPSGDDYLGGVLLALRLSAREAQAQSLWRWLSPRLAAATSPISAAHLAAAAEGEAHEALHECLRKLFGSERSWDEALGALDAVGHSSGWDGLAGAIAVLRAA